MYVDQRYISHVHTYILYFLHMGTHIVIILYIMYVCVHEASHNIIYVVSTFLHLFIYDL